MFAFYEPVRMGWSNKNREKKSYDYLNELLSLPLFFHIFATNLTFKPQR